MLKHVDPAGVLLAGGLVLAGVASRYQWSETTLFLVALIVAGVVTFAERRLARPKA